MASQSDNLEAFAVKLYKINAIKFGEFKTKVGLMTPVYCDLRVLVSYPDVMKSLCTLLVQTLKEIKGVDILCGVPYTALPIATAVSLETGLPMVMRRKEAKDYGTKKLIEGVFNVGDQCLIVEDVVTSGSSILETVKDLQNEGLKCSDAVVLLNREQGGESILQENGIKMHALLTLTELIDYLIKAKCIDVQTSDKVKQYLAGNQVTSIPREAPKVDVVRNAQEQKENHVEAIWALVGHVNQASLASNQDPHPAKVLADRLSLTVTKTREICLYICK